MPVDSAILLLHNWGLEKIACVAGVERGRGLGGWKERKGDCMLGRRLLLENVVIKLVTFLTKY